MGVRSKVGKATTINTVSDRLTKNPLFRNVGLGKWDLAEPPTRDETDELNVEQQPEPLPQHISANYDMRDAMASMLAREGPLHRQEIHDRLVETGIRIGGRNPVNNVGARLSRDPRFMRFGEGVWGLAELSTRDREDRLDTHAGSSDTDHDLGVGYDDQKSDEEDSVAW